MTRRAWTAVGAAGIAALALGATAVASQSPDGLERVAADLGFAGREAAVYEAPCADYEVPGLPGPARGPIAGLLGSVLVGCVAFGAGRLARRR